MSAKQGVCRWAAERSSQEQPAQTGVTPSGHAQCQIGRDSAGKSGAFVTLKYVKFYTVTSYIYPPSFTFLFKSLSFTDWVPGKSHLPYCYLKQGYLQQVFTMKTTRETLLYNAVNIKYLLKSINQIPLQEQKYKKVAVFLRFPHGELGWELYIQFIKWNIPHICFTRTCTSMRVGFGDTWIYNLKLNTGMWKHYYVN